MPASRPGSPPAGYAVYAFDLRGHGRSAGPRVAPDDWLDYVDDLDRFLASVEAREFGKKVFLFGHSMGGAIAALTAEQHRPALAGLILSGPTGPDRRATAADRGDARFRGLHDAELSGAEAPEQRLLFRDPANEQVMDRDELISQPPAPAKDRGRPGRRHARGSGPASIG